MGRPKMGRRISGDSKFMTRYKCYKRLSVATTQNINAIKGQTVNILNAVSVASVCNNNVLCSTIIEQEKEVKVPEQNYKVVTDPVDNKLLGVIRLGGPTIPSDLSPLYGQGGKQILVHGMLFSPDHRTLVVVSIGSNAIAFIDTATNAVKHITYVGRSPHEAGKEGPISNHVNTVHNSKGTLPM
jgi:YVTN family beta-propeller protein